MSKQITNSASHEEIQSLLPWFVNQTLDESDRALVSIHIKSCEECRQEIQFLSLMNATVQNDVQSSYGAHSDVDNALASVMRRIDAEEKDIASKPYLLFTLKNKLNQVLASFMLPPAAQWGAAAMAGLLVAVLGFQLFNSPIDDSYTALSSPDLDSSSIRLSLKLAPDNNWGQVRTVIKEEYEKPGRQFEFESTGDGSYHLVFDDSIGVDELSEIVMDLQNMTSIERVEMLP